MWQVRRSVFLVVGLVLSACAAKPERSEVRPREIPVADTIVFARKVHAMDGSGQGGNAVAIRDGRVLALSTTVGVLRYRGASTKLLRFPGAHVFPGLQDSHARFEKGVSPADPAALEQRLLALQARSLRVGLTRVHLSGLGMRELAAIRKLAKTARWKLGVYAMLDVAAEAGAAPVVHDPGPRARVRARAVRLVLDGDLEGRGAALLADYADAPGQRGRLAMRSDELARWLESCAERGLQPCVAAHGDRANRVALDVLAATLDASARQRLRPRLEHALVLAPQEIRRIAGLGVLASMQPVELTTGQLVATQRLGASRIDGSWAFGTLRRGGCFVSFGSAQSCGARAPFETMFAAETTIPPGAPRSQPRRLAQVVGREDAISGCTSDVAFAAFEEGVRGRLAPGFEADMTVVDRDLTTVRPGALLGTRVLATVVGGELVYELRRQPTKR